MLELRKHFGWGSLIIIVITGVLFIAAVISKGFTHDILLETAVFLVSVKLIMMSYKNIDETNALHKKLDKIDQKLADLEVQLTDKLKSGQ